MRKYFRNRLYHLYKKARELFFRYKNNPYIRRKSSGYKFYKGAFIFICPCRSMLSNNHINCNKYFTDLQKRKVLRKINTSMSLYNRLEKLPCFEYVLNIKEYNIDNQNSQLLSNFLLNIFLC